MGSTEPRAKRYVWEGWEGVKWDFTHLRISSDCNDLHSRVTSLEQPATSQIARSADELGATSEDSSGKHRLSGPRTPYFMLLKLPFSQLCCRIGTSPWIGIGPIGLSWRICTALLSEHMPGPASLKSTHPQFPVVPTTWRRTSVASSKSIPASQPPRNGSVLSPKKGRLEDMPPCSVG